MRSARSLLYVPGSRPDRFDKAAASGADIVCIDLEDAVADADKAAALAAALAHLEAPRTGPASLAVRINSLRSAHGFADVAALIASRSLPDLLVLPKAVSAHEPRLLHEATGGRVALCPMIESAEGLARAGEIAQAPGVAGLMFGAVDMAADLGVLPGWEPLLYARSVLVAACAAAGLALLDGPHTDLADEAGLAEASARGRALGFTGRSCIHPTQVAAVNAAFTPSAAERAWAARVVEAFEGAQGGVALLDGKLIERPIASAARRILERGGN